VSGLSNQDYLGLHDWYTFYDKDYEHIGYLSGTYYYPDGECRRVHTHTLLQVRPLKISVMSCDTSMKRKSGKMNRHRNRNDFRRAIANGRRRPAVVCGAQTKGRKCDTSSHPSCAVVVCVEIGRVYLGDYSHRVRAIGDARA
jgi:hypothetical protein